MPISSDINKLKSDLSLFAVQQLKENIIPFWLKNSIDNNNDGFYGRIDEENHADENSDKGLILNARILWTFSAVSRILNHPDYKKMADRAYDYILKYFYDSSNKGFYWKLDYKGNPKDTKKQIYALAFVIYALSEYYQLTGNKDCLNKAIETFEIIEQHSFDNKLNGYFEAFSKDWQLIEDLRLSDKDMNEKKTMNTHLHILEAYTNLYRVYKNDQVREKIKNLLNVFSKHIINKSDYHYELFFDEYWHVKSDKISYGHDIEGSWLMLEAAEVIGDKDLIVKFKEIAVAMANACLPGINPSSALSHDVERGKSSFSKDVEWWVEAEAVVGFYNAYQVSGKLDFLLSANKITTFINDYIVDHKKGEWNNQVSITGELIKGHDKAGFWKCPYHNVRMCLELMSRISK
jgi:cellobiose epimerase